MVAAVALPLASSAHAATQTRSDSFESGNLSNWDIAPNVTPSSSSVVVDKNNPCSGSYSALAHIPGSASANQFARTIWGNSSGVSGNLNLGQGTDFWYSESLFLPAGFTSSMQSYFVPMRWDNYGVSNVTRSGLAMYQDGTFRLMAEQDKVVPQYNLLGNTAFRLSEGVYHTLEVHQRLNSTNGQALNELYVDKTLVGSSTTRNYFGQPVSAIRYGIVAINQGTQTKPLTVRYDNAYLGSTRNPAASCGAAPAPAPAPSTNPTPAPTSPSGTDTQAPTAATSLHKTGGTSSSVAMAWNAATDNVGVARYEVWRGDAQYNNWVLVGKVGGTTRSFTDTTVKAGSTYTYGIRAFDAAGNKSASSNILVAPVS
jgi:hypothetical protein